MPEYEILVRLRMIAPSAAEALTNARHYIAISPYLTEHDITSARVVKPPTEPTSNAKFKYVKGTRCHVAMLLNGQWHKVVHIRTYGWAQLTKLAYDLSTTERSLIDQFMESQGFTKITGWTNEWRRN